jgi:hypothetical protein
MDPICMLIEAVAVELCCMFIVNKWIQLTGGFMNNSELTQRNVKRPLH